jgi:hypothetical protein
MTQSKAGWVLVAASVALLAVLGKLGLLLVLIPAAMALGFVLLRLQPKARVRLTMGPGARRV